MLGSPAQNLFSKDIYFRFRGDPEKAESPKRELEVTASCVLTMDNEFMVRLQWGRAE